jgi:D-alanyl-D-alanine carboxypeptidase
MDSGEKKKISISLLILNTIFVVSIIAMIFVIYDSSKKSTERNVVVANQVAVTHAFDNVNLEAKAVYIYDVINNKIIFKKNETAQLPLASLTKLMTALTASDLLPENSKITIKKEFLSEEGDNGLLANESWILKDLLDFSLVVSSNDGARSIASVIGATLTQNNDYNMGRKDFISKMNDKARELGLTETYFINESGLDEGSTSGGYGSAKNVEKLMQYILTNKPDLLEATKYSVLTVDSLSKEHKAINTNIVIDQIPGLIASKTGYTDLAGGNLAITFDASIGRPIVIVVLGSSEKGRFSDINQLVKASLDYIRE